MASTGRTLTVALGAAGAAALCSTAFVAPTAQTKSLRATRAVEVSSTQTAARATSSNALSVGLGAASAALAVGCASKRVGVSSSTHSVVAVKAFESELGVQDPVGFWDPVGFTADGDTAAFKRRRSVELKHGRISMMAAMGYITPEVTGKLPGFLSPSAGLKFADIPNGLAAISKVPMAGWAQIAAYFGFVEFSGGFDDYKTGTPGDYGFKVLTSSDP
ncbi:FCPA, partial [Symbiodinium pilosum]